MQDQKGTSENTEGLTDLRHPGKPSSLIVEAASDAIITIDEKSTILFINNAAERIFGYATDEMIGQPLTMLMPEYLRQSHREDLKRYLETGCQHIPWEAVEFPGRHKNGEEISLELSFGCFVSEGQHFFTGVARDITRRKRDAQLLTLQLSITRILAESSSIPETAFSILEAICLGLGCQAANFWLLDDEVHDLRKIASFPREHAEDLPSVDADLPDQGAPKGIVGRVWTSQNPVWENYHTDSGSSAAARTTEKDQRTTLGYPIKFEQRMLGVLHLLDKGELGPDSDLLTVLGGIGSQISQFIDRKNAENERSRLLLREHEARQEAQAATRQLVALQKITDTALAHLSLDALLDELLNRVRDVLHVDTVAILLLKPSGDELIVWGARGLEEEVELGVRIPVGKGFVGRIAEGRPVIIEDLARADLQNPLLLEKGIASLLGVPLRVEGHVIGVVHVGTFIHSRFTEEDITFLQLAADRIALAVENARLYKVEQDARAEAEQVNRAKDEFLTILSHELRTPLTPIMGWLHMMLTGILGEGEFTQALSIINKNAYALRRLINDLLDMSAIISGKMQVERGPVVLTKILPEALESLLPYAQEAKVHLLLDTQVQGDSLLVNGDRLRLLQVFSNLLHNAIKFSKPGGSVRLGCRVEGDNAIVTVKDEGEGIPPHFLPRIFERFSQADASVTRQHKGLGIGLALVKSFVEAHGGSVVAESEGEMKGSLFTVILPCQASRQPLKDPASYRPQISQSHKRILLVDDQTDTLEMLVETFRNRGFDTLACHSADEALQVADREPFDLIISDIAMPRVDGLELIRELRQRSKSARVPAIALTGYASLKDAEVALAAGFDRHFPKPVDPDELAGVVEDLLRLKAAENT